VKFLKFLFGVRFYQNVIKDHDKLLVNNYHKLLSKQQKVIDGMIDLL
jgi:hypothetical protein